MYESINSSDMRTIHKKYRWRLIGHVLRKPTTIVSLRLTSEGKRNQYRPKTKWSRTADAEVKDMGKAWSELFKKSKDREKCPRVQQYLMSK